MLDFTGTSFYLPTLCRAQIKSQCSCSNSHELFALCFIIRATNGWEGGRTCRKRMLTNVTIWIMFSSDMLPLHWVWLEYKMPYWMVTCRMRSYVCVSAVLPGHILPEWAHVRGRAATALNCELEAEARGSEKKDGTILCACCFTGFIPVWSMLPKPTG